MSIKIIFWELRVNTYLTFVLLLEVQFLELRVNTNLTFVLLLEVQTFIALKNYHIPLHSLQPPWGHELYVMVIIFVVSDS